MYSVLRNIKYALVVATVVATMIIGCKPRGAETAVSGDAGLGREVPECSKADTRTAGVAARGALESAILEADMRPAAARHS